MNCLKSCGAEDAMNFFEIGQDNQIPMPEVDRPKI